MSQDDTYQTNVYYAQGGGNIAIGSSGDLTIESDGAIRALSGGSMACSEAFDFFLAGETFFTDRMRNALMGRGRWSVIVGSTGETISATIGPNITSFNGVNAAPVTPSRTGYIVFSLANADAYSVNLHSAHSGEECCIILRGEAGDAVSIILRCSADDSTKNFTGVSIMGTSGDQLSSLLLYASAASRAFVRLLGITEGTWAIIGNTQATGTGNQVVEQTMV